jgi:ATP-dependent DNA ligase
MNLNDFFNLLASNNGRLFKVDLLEKNRDNKLLREVVRLALDPFTQFYIRKIPKYTPNTGKGIDLEFALDSLYDLSSRQVTGNAGIAHLKGMLEALNEDDAKVIERIIQKDLKCGVSTSTANAVWTGLLKEYPVMLCSQFEEKLVNKIKFPALVQLKMDGMRFNAIVRDGKVEYRSRNGKEIQLLGNLDADFIALAGDVDCVFDGELLVTSDTGILDRQTGNGILNKANKGTITAGEASLVRATVWDVIPFLYFQDGVCNTPYGTRFDSLNRLINKIEPEKVSTVKSWEVEDYETAKALFEEMLQRGEEGIILKDKAGIWEDKRSKTQIKFKGELECDLKIVGIEEGTGKYAGMLGAIQCESSDGVIKVSVGSGFTDAQRKSLGKEIIGKVAAVKYNMRISNRAGEESLFLPIVLEIRFDKDEADASTQIK